MGCGCSKAEAEVAGAVPLPAPPRPASTGPLRPAPAMTIRTTLPVGPLLRGGEGEEGGWEDLATSLQEEQLAGWGADTASRIGEDVRHATPSVSPCPSAAPPADPLSLLPDSLAGPEADFAVGELIGKGSFGRVYLGVSKQTGERAALKVMDRAKLKPQSIYREWNVLHRMGTHPAIVSYAGSYKTPKEVVFVLEHMQGGELFDRLVKRGPYSEAEARAPFRALGEGLAYLHSRGIVHRDIKPENLLLKYDADSIAPRVHANPESSASASASGPTRPLTTTSAGGRKGHSRLSSAASVSAVGATGAGAGVGGAPTLRSTFSSLLHARSSSKDVAAPYPPSASGSADPGALLPMPGGLCLEPVLKISDLGLSQLIGRGEKLLKVCGTWAYGAPEMSDPARQGYTCKFDVFSFGVVLYVTLCGFHPFDPSGALPVAEIKARARSATFDFCGEEWAGVSDLGKDLISRLIVKDPERRLDSRAMLRHPWFRLPGEAPLPLPLPRPLSVPLTLSAPRPSPRHPRGLARSRFAPPSAAGTPRAAGETKRASTTSTRSRAAVTPAVVSPTVVKE